MWTNLCSRAALKLPTFNNGHTANGLDKSQRLAESQRDRLSTETAALCPLILLLLRYSSVPRTSFSQPAVSLPSEVRRGGKEVSLKALWRMCERTTTTTALKTFLHIPCLLFDAFGFCLSGYMFSRITPF